MAKAPVKPTTLRVARPSPEAPPPTAAPPMTYDAAAQYRITLSRTVTWAGRVLRVSSPRIVVSGEVAEQIKDAIKTAEKL